MKFLRPTSRAWYKKRLDSVVCGDSPQTRWRPPHLFPTHLQVCNRCAVAALASTTNADASSSASAVAATNLCFSKCITLILLHLFSPSRISYSILNHLFSPPHRWFLSRTEYFPNCHISLIPDNNNNNSIYHHFLMYHYVTSSLWVNYKRTIIIVRVSHISPKTHLLNSIISRYVFHLYHWHYLSISAATTTPIEPNHYTAQAKWQASEQAGSDRGRFLCCSKSQPQVVLYSE